jgi:hypothetical protein
MSAQQEPSMSYRFLRQDAHPNCWRPLHASGLPIAQFTSGGLADPVPGPVVVRISAWAQEPTDFMERPFMVVSSRMRAALERAGVDNIQYIEAQLQPERSERLESGYWLANIVGKLACVDAFASGVDNADEVSLASCSRLVIDPLRTCGIGLFRLAEDPRMILAAPHVQAALLSAGLRGVLFQDTTMYNAGRAISRSELEAM